jgi:hypothetical protein
MSDTSRGYTLIPGMSGTYRKEGSSFVTINADGFRDIAHAVEKPVGTVRIAVIGDSYVEGLQVSGNESFARYMETTVRTCGIFRGAPVEVLKFGVSGYGTAQELLVLREKVWKYSPDVVMLLVTTNNDITDNARSFKKNPIPYFVYRDGALVLDDAFLSERAFIVKHSALNRLGIWLKNNLRSVQAIGEVQVALKHRYRAWKDAQTQAPAGEGATVPDTITDVGIDNQVYRPPADPEWENAWHVTEGLIDMMKHEVEAGGAKFVVVTASNGVQVLPDPANRAGYAKKLGVDDLLYPDRRIAGFCRLQGVPVITLAPVLAEHAARENVFLHGFDQNVGYGHWNHAGHRVAGEEIGRQLCGGLLP